MLPIADRRYRIGERPMRIKDSTGETTDRRSPISDRGKAYEQCLRHEGDCRLPISPIALSGRGFADGRDSGAQGNCRLPISPIALSGRGFADGRDSGAQGNCRLPISPIAWCILYVIAICDLAIALS